MGLLRSLAERVMAGASLALFLLVLFLLLPFVVWL